MASGPFALAPDTTGDGLPELWVSSPGVRRLYLLDGATTGSNRPDEVALGAVTDIHSGGQFGMSMATGTDLTGDGGSDLAIGGFGSAHVIPELPVPNGTLDALASVAVVDPQAISFFDVAVGDVAGDGAPDLLVRSSLEGDSYRGVVWVLTGPLLASGAPGELAGTTLTGAVPSEGFGTTVAVDDFDGDGTPDLAVSSASAPMSVFSGPLPGGAVESSDAETRFVGEQTTDGLDVVAPGDLDGDGTVDLLLGHPTSDGFRRRMYVVPGPVVPGQQTAASRATSVFLGTAPSFVGAAVSTAAWDVDGDEVLDLVLGDAGIEHGAGKGEISVFFGPLPGGSVEVDVDATFQLYGSQTSHDYAFGWSVRPLADLDGDGLPEFAVGEDDALYVLSSALLASPI